MCDVTSDLGDSGNRKQMAVWDFEIGLCRTGTMTKLYAFVILQCSQLVLIRFNTKVEGLGVFVSCVEGVAEVHHKGI